GLKYGGFGYWKDPQTGETKFKTVDDQLVPVEGEETSELAGKGVKDGGDGRPPGQEGLPGNERTAGRGATQQPRGPGSEPGRNIGTAEPGMEQAPKRMRWDPGPDGDHCVDSGQPPGDIPDDAFVKKTNYYQWTAGPDGTNFMNVSYDNIMKAAREQGDQTAQAPPGGMNEGIEGWADRPTDKNTRVLRRRAQRARGEEPSGPVTRGDERVMLDPAINAEPGGNTRDRKNNVNSFARKAAEIIGARPDKVAPERTKGFDGANTMMNQMLGLGDKKPGTTMKKAKKAVDGLKGEHDTVLGNQLASMLEIVRRGKHAGQETWDAEMGKANDMWRKALKLPDIKNVADAVKKMNTEAKNLVSHPDFDMEMGEELGEGSFGKVGISAKDPDVVIKEGQIGPKELIALHAMRDNPRFPSLINAEFQSPFTDSDLLEDIGNSESGLNQISKWWDPEADSESSKPQYPVALGRFAMTKLKGQPLDGYSPSEEDYDMDEDGESGVGDIARKIFQLRGMLHRKGLSHNDMHGGNIYIDDNGELSLLDLGMANDDPLSALTEATGGIGLKDYMEGDRQLAVEGQWGNLPRGLAKQLMDNASGVREMIYDAMTDHMEGLDDQGVADFDDALEVLMTGGIRQQKEVLDSLRERIPMLQDRGSV
ncbi:MAG: hypothetical protein EB162_05365, partial [Euryarchaeota archaeon]|nr:hypothetical protein [Euryarchaeota archaeon]